MKNNTNWQQIAQAFGLLTLIGITILANIAVGFWLGKVIDNYLNFDLFFKIIGIIIGVISGFYSVYRLTNGILGDNNEDK